MPIMNKPEHKRCPILSNKDRIIYCTTGCMAFMINEKGFGCKLINSNSEKEAWHKYKENKNEVL